MKTRLPALLLSLACLPAGAELTVAGYPACRQPAWLELMLAFQARGDTASFERYQDRGQCLVLKDGIQVEVIDYYLSPDNLERVEFRIKGFIFYTVPEALGKPL